MEVLIVNRSPFSVDEQTFDGQARVELGGAVLAHCCLRTRPVSARNPRGPARSSAPNWFTRKSMNSFSSEFASRKSANKLLGTAPTTRLAVPERYGSRNNNPLATRL